MVELVQHLFKNIDSITCMRLQSSLLHTMDKEFKLFMKKNKGLSIDAGLFDLKFVEPQSFNQYKEIEVHAARANVFGGLEGVSHEQTILMEKYLVPLKKKYLKTSVCGKKKTLVVLHLMQKVYQD